MSEREYYYEDEIDLRELVRTLIAGWRWIAGFTIAAGLLALGVSMMLPKQYEASASVALTEPAIIFRFDPRITTEIEVPTGKGITELALSDDVLKQILESEAAASMDPNERIADILRGKLEAKLSDTLLILTVEDDDATRAAALANAWAVAVTRRLNDLYAPSSQAQTLFEAQAQAALEQWQAAQQELIDFQAANPERILIQRLAAQENTLAKYLEANRALELVAQDARALQARLREQPSGAEANLQDDLATLLLTSRSLSSSTSLTASAAPYPLDLQFQIQGDSLLGESSAEQAQYLEALIESLETQRIDLEKQAAQLEEEIYKLQGDLAQAQEERSRLEQDRDLARDTYETLARKAQESSLAAQDREPVAQVASRAAVPSKPEGPRVKLNTGLGSMLGFMMGVFWTFAASWWISGDQLARNR